LTRSKQYFHSRDASSDEHLKILMMVRSGSFAADLAGVPGWLMSALPRNDNTPKISLVPRMLRSALAVR
jgi:hypothetical protein